MGGVGKGGGIDKMNKLQRKAKKIEKNKPSSLSGIFIAIWQHGKWCKSAQSDRDTKQRGREQRLSYLPIDILYYTYFNVFPCMDKCSSISIH